METNTSSVRIRKFDEQVAKVRGADDQDFRELIGRAYRDSEVLRYFFPGQLEKPVPRIGVWLLKLGCLHAGVPPKEGFYEKAAKYLFEDSSKKDAVPKNLSEVFKDAEWVLKRVSDMGSPTLSTLPSWPPVHVLAGIRSRYLSIKHPEETNAARPLIDAYYWRCLFTNRHKAQANDRLHQDFEQLVEALESEEIKGISMRVFSNRQYPLYRASVLVANAGWIGRSRTGRALVSAVLASEPRPVDWITGESLGVTHVRQLERAKNLDRHHVFPKNVLLAAGVALGEVNNGLNGVLLEKRTNRKFWKYTPDDYVEKVTEKRGIEKPELSERICGHVVPFEAMVNSKGTIKQRYRTFLEEREKFLAQRIEELAALPE